MRYELNNDILKIYFEGELNSYNADNVEHEIEDILLSKTFKSLTLDFANLHYISSAGLRIILKLKQKYNDVKVVEVSLEVFDVLSMTGFTNIMEVQKALKRVYISGAQVIGEGFFSTVYRVDKDTIIKVFNRVSDPEQIGRELKLAKQAFVLGIPTAISFDIVRVDDKLGVRFEMLDCKSLRDVFRDEPDQYEKHLASYISLLKKINSTDCMDPSIPSMKNAFLRKIDNIQKEIGDAPYKKIRKMIEELPDSMTFVHGDCHFKNIMVQGEDFLLIDMDTLSRGEPIFELATLRAPYVAFEEDDPGNTTRFLGMAPEWCSKLFDDLVKGCLGNPSEDQINKIKLLCAVHMIDWNKVNTPDNKVRLEGNKARLLSLCEKVNDLKL